jgi:hypothetical protein
VELKFSWISVGEASLSAQGIVLHGFFSRFGTDMQDHGRFVISVYCKVGFAFPGDAEFDSTGDLGSMLPDLQSYFDREIGEAGEDFLRIVNNELR